jgi:hypothetical protein
MMTCSDNYVMRTRRDEDAHGEHLLRCVGACVSINIHQRTTRAGNASPLESNSESLALGLQYAIRRMKTMCINTTPTASSVKATTSRCTDGQEPTCHLSPSNWLPRASHVSATHSSCHYVAKPIGVNSGPCVPFRVRTLITNQFLLTPVRPGMILVSSRRSPDLKCHWT